MSYKGFPGARAFWGSEMVEQIFKEASRTFLVPKDEIMMGFNENPPMSLGCRVYILVKDSAVEFLRPGADGWVNWSYQEQ